MYIILIIIILICLVAIYEELSPLLYDDNLDSNENLEIVNDPLMTKDNTISNTEIPESTYSENDNIIILGRKFPRVKMGARIRDAI